VHPVIRCAPYGLPNQRYRIRIFVNKINSDTLDLKIRMPQLPSGRTVAIDPDPLITLIDDRNPLALHKVMAIRSVEDIFPYVELVYIVPASEAPVGSTQPKLHASALPCPPGHVVVESEKRMSDLSEVAAQCSEADRVAMDEFVSARAVPLLEKF